MRLGVLWTQLDGAAKFRDRLRQSILPSQHDAQLGECIDVVWREREHMIKTVGGLRQLVLSVAHQADEMPRPDMVRLGFHNPAIQRFCFDVALCLMKLLRFAEPFGYRSHTRFNSVTG